MLHQISKIFYDQNISEESLGVNLEQPNTSFDSVLIKKLAKSQTLTHGTSTKQTHLAFTGKDMDIFPYLHNYSYLDSPQPETNFKRRYVLELPITLLSNNMNYLAGEKIEEEDKIIESYTTTARSRRSDNTQQIEVSYIREDDNNFVNFRKQLYTGDYIIFLKYYKQPKYIVLGIKDRDSSKYQLDNFEGLTIINKVEPTHVTITETDSQNSLTRETNSLYESPTLNKIINLLERNPNLILYGPPGTGKTYYVNQLKKYFDFSEIITFHQSYSYEQFVEGITAKVDQNLGQLTYIIEKGIFRNISEYARNNSEKKVALFIDEINRGNVSKIFGELITLIEKSKRENESEETSVKLPYSKEYFTVPKNLYIIGTMNTSDRSVALIDIALRRRFSFFEITPNFTFFEQTNEKIENTIKAIKNINGYIKKVIDKEHMIGNSYFFSLLNKNESELDDEIKYIWVYQILPLLQEYFYTNPKTITDVLGSLVLDSDQRFSFSINYEISNEDLLKTIETIASKEL
ncbi:McrB family protein [Peribacillus tepidiphilus]|uniref:McrB family protein n=1 Tax=Peribacillus tepidiphilus TaxID=2652445 RepID=UPI001781460D|nr:AAA family ATPase [Peribacillus tepidiphilus]